MGLCTASYDDSFDSADFDSFDSFDEERQFAAPVMVGEVVDYYQLLRVCDIPLPSAPPTSALRVSRGHSTRMPCPVVSTGQRELPMFSVTTAEGRSGLGTAAYGVERKPAVDGLTHAHP